MQIEGKTVLVTGPSSGVGAAIAKAMAQAGAAKVLLLARNEDALESGRFRAVAAPGADGPHLSCRSIETPSRRRRPHAAS